MHAAACCGSASTLARPPPLPRRQVNEEGYLSPVKSKTVKKQDWWFDQDDIRCHPCDWYTDSTACGKNIRCSWDHGRADKGGQKCNHLCSFEVIYPEHRACCTSVLGLEL